MAVTIDGTNGITSSGSITTQSASGVIFSDSSALTAASSPYVLKNRIINGAMVIDQRNAGGSVTANDNIFIVDRWKSRASQSSKMTGQQNAGSVTPPVGFSKYLGITSSSAYTVGSTDYFWLSQLIEGFNTSDLAWGTANAKTVTLSFYVYSSLTGSFGGCLRDGNGGTAQYPFSYTISSANTWTQISITVSGATIGTWQTNNLASIEIVFGLGIGSTYSGTANAWTASLAFAPIGSTSVVGTNGATFYITGVQLEIGSTATPFERRLYNQELANCQRYYYLHAGNSQSIGIGYYYNATIATVVCQFPVSMRTSPTLTSTSGTSYYNFARNGATNNLNSFSLGAASLNLAYLNNSTEASGTAGQAGLVSCGASGSIAFNAEL